MDDVAAVGRSVYGELLNLCIWNKCNAGMGSLYRSKHELVFVYRVGTAPHFNAVELGRHGRNRTNVWDYASVNSLAGSRREDLALHPTVKPTALVADAIQDVTRRGDLVLDIFLGSGHNADRGRALRAPVPRGGHRSGLCRCRDRALGGDDRRHAASWPSGDGRMSNRVGRGSPRPPAASARARAAIRRAGRRHGTRPSPSRPSTSSSIGR